MKRFVEVEDLDSYIRNYRKNKHRIEVLKLDYAMVEAEIGRSAGSIVVISKDQKQPRSNQYEISLVIKSADIEERIGEFKIRLKIVDDFLTWLKENDFIWLEIVEGVMKGERYEDIGEKTHYSLNAVRKIYYRSIREYIKSTINGV